MDIINDIATGFLMIMIALAPYIGYALGIFIGFKIIMKSVKKDIEKYKNEEKGRQ
jgi:uncharacterized protein YneF (UPF0154 family)